MNTNTGQANIGAQERRLLEYMQTHRCVSRYTGMAKCGIANVPEIIRRLKVSGVQIGDEWKTKTNRYGEKVRYKRWFLLEENNAAG